VLYLGIDTSNYTTSAALYDAGTGAVLQRKQLLPVKEGAVGQRQSDAVFGHVKQLGVLMEELMAERSEHPAAVGVSISPRDEAGSYMPCFLAGEMAARSVAAVAGIPLHRFSHQGGHVAAALYGAGKIDLFGKEFLAFHVSGGTTQCLLVKPGENIFDITTVAESLDLHAGQAVDRVGHKLGLRFPAGVELEKLAETCREDYKPKPSMKGADCCLSGLENRCGDMLEKGEPPENVAKYCLCYLRETLSAMTTKVLEQHPGLPIIYAGGVMSNRFLQQAMGSRFSGSFAPAAYSADNAAGVAVLTAIRAGEEIRCSP
jgi:N6-L-threonylcarbamoyladenine synthase